MTYTTSGHDIEILPGHNRIAAIRREPSSLHFATSRTTRPMAWLFSLIVAVSLTITPQPSIAAGYTSADIVAGTNNVRQQNGLASLNVNAQLSAAAQAKAADMFARQYFNHYSPTGQAPWYWIQQSGYAFTNAGENLAIDFADGSDLMNAWMNSTTHRANLLNVKYTDIGVAVVDGTMNGLPTTLVVQFFGNQKVATATTPVAVTIPSKPTPAKPSPVKPKPVVVKVTPKAIVPAKTVVVTTPTEPIASIPAVPVEQPQVLGISDPKSVANPIPKPKIVPITYIQTNNPLISQSPVSQQLPSVLLAVFAGYMALFSLAGVMAYLHKSMAQASLKQVAQLANSRD